MFLKNKKAQSIIEYAMVLVIVMGAFVAIGNYIKRGVQGRMKMATDDMGDQYDPRVANSSVEYRQVVNSTTTIIPVNMTGGTYTRREDIVTTVETKNGYLSIEAY